jgi:hypothetical protein
MNAEERKPSIRLGRVNVAGEELFLTCDERFL